MQCYEMFSQPCAFFFLEALGRGMAMACVSARALVLPELWHALDNQF